MALTKDGRELLGVFEGKIAEQNAQDEAEDRRLAEEWAAREVAELLEVVRKVGLGDNLTILCLGQQKPSRLERWKIEELDKALGIKLMGTAKITNERYDAREPNNWSVTIISQDLMELLKNAEEERK